MASSAIDLEMHDGTQVEDAQAVAFQALEQRVLRAIELLRKERELRADAEQRAQSAEQRIHELQSRSDEQASHLHGLTTQLDERTARLREQEATLAQLEGERDQVRQRVQRLLQHLDEFTA